MSRFLFPAAIAIILASVAFAHWEKSGAAPVPTTLESSSPSGNAATPIAPTPQTGQGKGQ
ncbi:hypothetical protein MKL09_06685 [Methylobacterium sp. J-048]|uniref:hypothetical protein n=1 Tax=Methylobacterium sp. J-048 TaxID=2836635 RepID=UPI001FB9AED1|nr:hypothetical protein [Methylobacterium sp. J-048]MCJ2056233.1 hypothetical protein [Methylobacterium sp. J-048]